MKKKSWRTILGLGCCIPLLMGCAMESPESIKIRKDSEIVKKEALKVDEESENFYRIGEKIETIDTDQNEKDFVASEYTVNSAKIYNNPSEAGIEKEALCENVEYYKGLLPDNCELTDRDTAMDSKILVCDLTIKNIDIRTCNITEFVLVYEKEDKELVRVGFPAYFSAPKNMSTEYYDYDLLEGKSMTVQVGWMIDEKVLEVEPLDKEHFFLVQNFGSNPKYEKVIALDL